MISCFSAINTTNLEGLGSHGYPELIITQRRRGAKNPQRRRKNQFSYCLIL